MRQKFGWIANPQYIVNLTRNLLGANLVWLKQDERAQSDPLWLLGAVSAIAMSKIKEMNSETLGKICEYGTQEGFHRPPIHEWDVEFLNCTGFRDVLPGCFCVEVGRDLLELMSLATIACVVRDILLQETWQRKAEEDRAREHAYERVQHSAIHPDRHRS